MPRPLRALLAVAAVAAVLAAACGDDDDSGDSAELEEEETQAGETDDGRRQGGEITVAMIPLAALDPRIPGDLFTDIALHRMIWRGLYSLDPDNNVVSDANGIAAALPEVSADGRTVTVSLNEGLGWSDGDDLRAEDFVAGIVRSCNPLVGAAFQYLLSNIVGCDDFYLADPATADLDGLQAGVGVRAVDEHTVEFQLQEPQPTFPIALSFGSAFPVPVHLDRFASATAENPGDWGDDPGQLVYNGPYVVESWDPDHQVVLRPNEEWQGLVKPTLERITLRFFDMADLTPALDAFRNGDVQAMQMNGVVSDAAQIRPAAEEFADSYLKYPVAFTHSLALQLDDETLSNRDVRLALARAIDREALNREILGDINQITTSWIPPNTSGVALGAYDETIGFDPAAASERLEAAGYPQGEGFPPLLIHVNEDSPQDIATAEFLKTGFKQILNIDLTVELVDRDTRNRLFTAGQYQLLLVGWAVDYPDPESWMLGLFNTDGGSNTWGCSNPEIDALLEEAAARPLDDQRRTLYADAERIVVTTVCGVIPQFQEAYHYLVDGELVGLLENVSDSDTYLPGELVPEAWGLRADQTAASVLD
jgi:oligopeptide transport system substrate-binding protein